MTSHTHDNPFDALNQTEDIKSATMSANTKNANNNPEEQIIAHNQPEKSVESSWGQLSENDKSKLTVDTPSATRERPSLSRSSSRVEKKEELTIEDRYNKAMDLKESGKKFVQEHKFEDAIGVYSAALTQINPHIFNIPPQGDLRKKIFELKTIILNNISQCKLSLGRVEDALWYAEKVVVQDPENVKALFRIAMCYEKQQKYIEAYDKLKEIVQIHKRKDLALSVEIKEALERIRSESQGDLDKQKKQERELYQRMVTGKESRDSETVRTKSTTAVKKSLLLLPSAVIAYLIINKGLKYDLRSHNSRGAAAVLTFTLFGSLFTEKLWLRGALAATACALTGAAYRYRLN